MTITSKIVATPPVPLPPPVLESVTLTLTPREALLLASLIGNLSRPEHENILNKAGCGGKSYLENPPFDAPKSITYPLNNDDLKMFATLYCGLADKLAKAVAQGVK